MAKKLKLISGNSEPSLVFIVVLWENRKGLTKLRALFSNL